MYNTFIFDFDYTLGDSTDGIVQCANYGLEKIGFGACDVETIRKTIGLSLKNTYEALTGRADDEEADVFISAFKEKADEVMTENSCLYEGVKDTLLDMKKKGYRIGIVTTKYRYRIEQILSKYNALNMVDIIIGGDDVKLEKPAPEGLLMAVNKLDSSKDDVLYVGDSIVDAKTACNAEISFAGVLTGTTTREDFEQYPYVLICEDVIKLAEVVVEQNHSEVSGK
ncbi:MAG: HAD family hydrolase [Lachnospiraceae bacterium]|nr:HAD family hydrolase [Lachnospiraceae bacterium]